MAGQRQLVAFARAFLANPAVLVAAASGRYAGLHRSWRQSLA
jgi:predicted ABC-type transport system involved in lysophospholipase L1 biosynthesis ATPase subunit